VEDCFTWEASSHKQYNCSFCVVMQALEILEGVQEVRVKESNLCFAEDKSSQT
jgi:hypothetical protein